MKTIKYLVLLVAAAMFLAACGGGTDGDGGPDTGSLTVNVSDADTGAAVEAEIVVSDSSGAEVDTQTASSFTWEDFDPGGYSVAATADGYLDYGPQSVNVVAGEETTLSVEMTPEGAVGGNVEDIELGFADVDGNGYVTNEEINPVKDATLLAAQTEEQVGISVLVTDENGDPVGNAPVTVNVTGDFSDALAIYPGQASVESANNAFQGLETDGDGMAHFVIEATNADLTLQEILNFLLGEGLSQNEVLDVFEPIKLVVSAVGDDNLAKRVEFKSFFTNMSHLWYGEGTPDPDTGLVDLDEEDPDLTYTEQRLGADLGTIPNIWTNQSENEHYFGTWALTKQPSQGPYRVGVGTLSDLLGEEVGEVEPALSAAQDEDDYPTGLSGYFPGYMEYTLSDVSTDEDGNALVEWDGTAGLCEDVSSDGTVCTDTNGSGVGLAPVSEVDLEDLPVEATVTATYYFVVDYGDESYEFALKDYTFTKEWIGGFLTVDKHVENHVLTWYGEDVTLDASDAVSDGDYLSTVHVDVTNDSDSDIYNVTVRDAVPAELGVVTDSISGNGTYDPINHVVTWNYNQEPSLENIAVGESEEFTFDVYARHKPGYCWEGVDDGSFNVQPRPGLAEVDGETFCETAYTDPYRVTNGGQNQSVTAAGFFEDSTTGEQLVFSYSPVKDESDIWVVRPLFEILKRRVSQSVMPEGASADYRISVRQLDRVAMDAAGGNPASVDYADLDARYPWEFGGALGDAPADWHVGDASVERNNPYAHDVEVVDAFDHGLDFTNGTSFSNVSGGTIETAAPTVEKEANWSPIDDLPVGVTAEAGLTLTGNLISDNNEAGAADSTSPANDENGAVETVLNPQGFERFAWENCAFLGAPQLNQALEQSGETGAGFTWYDTVGWFPWTFSESGPDFVSNATNDNNELFEARGFVGTDQTYGEGQLLDCANVAIIPPPPQPFVTLTTNGEFDTGETDEIPEIIDENLKDGYEVDEEFVYKVTAENAGGTAAENIDMTLSLNNSVVVFNGDASLYIGSPTLGWTLQETITPSSSTTTFTPIDLPADQFIRIVIEARANQSGVAEMTTLLDYDNPPASQNTPLEVLEETSVQ